MVSRICDASLPCSYHTGIHAIIKDKLIRSIYLSIYLSIHPSIYLSIYLPIHQYLSQMAFASSLCLTTSVEYFACITSSCFCVVVSRLHCESESFKMELILDVNTQIYPVDLGEYTMSSCIIMSSCLIMSPLIIMSPYFQLLTHRTQYNTQCPHVS